MSLATNVQNLATAVGADVKAINQRAGDLASLTTSAKASLVAAINEVNAKPSGTGGAAINDNAPSATTTYSSTKTEAVIASQVSALIASAPTALDTLKELSDALGGDANFASTVTAALAQRVRADAAQTFSTSEQLQARTNIAAAGATDVGDTETDFVATYNTAKA